MSSQFARNAFIAEQNKFADEFSRTASSILRNANRLPTDRELKYRELLLQQKVIDAETQRSTEAFKEYLEHRAANSNPPVSNSAPEVAATSSRPTPDDSKDPHIPARQ